MQDFIASCHSPTLRLHSMDTVRGKVRGTHAMPGTKASTHPGMGNNDDRNNRNAEVVITP